MNLPKKAFLFVFLLLILSSCNIQKRHYNRGFHVDGIMTTKGQDKVDSKRKIPLSKPTFNSEFIATCLQPTILSDSLKTVSLNCKLMVGDFRHSKPLPSPELLTLITKSIRHNRRVDTLKCDVMVLRNGDEIDVHVLEVGDELIKYKMCNNINGPIFTTRVDKVFMLKYINGTKTVFNQTQTSFDVKPQNESLPYKEIPFPSFVSLVSGIIGLFYLGILFGLLAIIFGLIGMSMSINQSNKYKGHGLAVLSIIIGIFDVIILLILL